MWAWTPGWLSFQDELAKASQVLTVREGNASEPALVYYTSGTTGNPKAVMHSHFYTGAHWVTGKYWIDLKPFDLFWCIAGTGWAKAAGSVLFGPWNCGAATILYNAPFDAKKGLELLERYEITRDIEFANELPKTSSGKIRRVELRNAEWKRS